LIEQLAKRTIPITAYSWLLPRKEYKTITVKIKTFYRFSDALRNAKVVNAEMSNSKFLSLLLDLYESKESHDKAC
jgi:hypothetical protein